MVRKATRAAALKASEKARESPRRGRRRKSTSSSENSDDEALTKKKLPQPKETEKGSSEADDSDTDSKKPLKKRQTRSRATKSKSSNKKSDTTASTTTDTPTPITEPDTKENKSDDDNNQQIEAAQQEIVKEDSKGKSLNSVNESQISDQGDNVPPKQVTDESPVIDRDEPPTATSTKVPEVNNDDDSGDVVNDNDEPSKNGELSAIDVNISQSLVAEMTCDNNQSSEVTSEEITEIVISEHQGGNNEEEENSADLTQSLEPSMDEDKTIKPKPLSIRDEQSQDHGNSKRKITLKRPEKTVVVEEASGNSCWGSTYEDDKKEGEKPLRKKITLKRSTMDETRANETKKEEASLNRSISAPESVDEQPKSEMDNIVIEKKRRRSSVMEKTSENEEKPAKPKKPVKVVKLIRPGTVQEQFSPPPDEPREPSAKKRRWNQTDLTCRFIPSVDFEQIKHVYPSLDLLGEDEVDLDLEAPLRSPEKLKQRKTFLELEEEEMEKIEAELNAEPDQGETRENIIAMNRKISIVEDTASKLKPPPSPAKNPLSQVLFITNLVRPFTAKQLRELLERTGKIKEDGFWTDRIKSKCYVCYESAEEAESTRNALHGVHWPIGNGKKLIIDYSTVEDMENAKNPPPPVVAKPPKSKSPEKENKKPDLHEKTKGKEEEEHHHHHHRKRRSPSRSSRERRERKHSRRSYTPEDLHNKKRKVADEPVLVKAMDDLFRKTVATPSIYWQPLSPEEIAQKQQQRQARLEMNKRRMAEFRTTSSRGGAPRDRSGRDRNFRRR